MVIGEMNFVDLAEAVWFVAGKKLMELKKKRGV